MTILFVRIFFGLLTVVAGYYIGSFFIALGPYWPVVGAIVGFFAASILILGEIFIRKISIRNLSAGLVGLAFGIFMSWILATGASTAGSRYPSGCFSLHSESSHYSRGGLGGGACRFGTVDTAATTCAATSAGGVPNAAHLWRKPSLKSEPAAVALRHWVRRQHRERHEGLEAEWQP